MRICTAVDENTWFGLERYNLSDVQNAFHTGMKQQLMQST